MKTLIRSADDASIEAAIHLLEQGEVVAFPTETVYGLGADALNENAVRRIFAAKDRPTDNPLIVHVAEPGDAEAYAADIPPVATTLIEHFWPGPLSLVLPKTSTIPDRTTGNLPTVVLRCPAHPVAHTLIKRFGRPIAAPSANRSGRVSPTTAAHVLTDLTGRIPLILDDGNIEYGLESTVVDCTEDTPLLLRPGSITLESLRSVIPNLSLPPTTAPPRSPGMKYRHYAPSTPVTLYRGDRRKTTAAIAAAVAQEPDVAVLWQSDRPLAARLVRQLPAEPTDAAPELFEALRAADAIPAARILVQGYSNSGIGAAIMNRLEKAASEIVDV